MLPRLYITKFTTPVLLQRQFSTHITMSQPPLTAALQVVLNGSYNSYCIMYKAGQQRYLFNVGECIQKYLGLGTGKMWQGGTVFITGLSWKNVGGLPTYILDLENSRLQRANSLKAKCKEIDKTKVSIYGPKGIDAMSSFTKNVLFRQHIPIAWNDLLNDETIVTDDMTVLCLKLTKGSNNVQSDNRKIENPSSSVETHMYTKNQSIDCMKRKIDADVDSSQPVKKWASEECRSEYLVSYICNIKGIKGKLNVKKCMDAGVPFGPLLGRLKSGEDVILSNGTVVYSKDVCDQPNPDVNFAVLECPSEDYLDALINHPKYKEYQAPDTENKLCLIFHMTPEHLIQNPKYQQWMKQFPSYVQHYILNEKNQPFHNIKTYGLQHRLHKVQPVLYPLLPMEYESSNVDNALPAAFIRVMDLFIIHLRPKVGIEPINLLFQSEKQRADMSHVIADVEDDVLLKEYRKKCEIRKSERRTLIEAEASVGAPNYPRILFLGTGASCTNSLRNVSGILVQIDEKHSMLLDCGEGTIEQLQRFYTRSGANKILSTLKGIFISHKHGDHQYGIIGVLNARAKVTDEPIQLLTCSAVYDTLQRFDMSIQSVPPFNYIFNGDISEKHDDLCKALNLSSIKTASVLHCRHAFGIRIVLPNGKSIAYSGDTMVCDNMIRLAEDVDLLIHEATLDNKEQLSSALFSKRHCTIPQAIEVGIKSRAKHVLLTHLSQRFSKFDISHELPDNTYIAHDFMECTLDTLPLAHNIHKLFHICRVSYGERLNEAFKWYDERQNPKNTVGDHAITSTT